MAPKFKFDCAKHQLALYICGPAFIIGCVLFGAIYQLAIDNLLDQRAYVCSKDNFFYDAWADSSKSGAQLIRSFYFYNISNPYEALNGGTYELTEVGPWAYKYTVKKYNIDFLHNGTVRYREHRMFTWSGSKSCSDCLETAPLNVINIPWQVLLMNARSEGVVLLSTQCTTTQIANIPNTTMAMCADDERGTSVDCRCCAPAGASPTCANLISPTSSNTTALLSWLAKMDGSAVSSYEAPAISLVDEVHSPVIVSASPRAIIGGRPSALMGLIQARQAITGGNDDALEAIAKFTKEYYTACSSHCPDPFKFGQELQKLDSAAQLDLIKDTTCTGTITEDDAVVSGVYKEYLVGMDCKPAYYTFLGLLFSSPAGSTKECALSGSSPPCCMKSAYFATFNGGTSFPGWGCIKELPGYTVTRRTTSTEEWDEVNQENYEEITGCKSGQEPLAQEFTEFKSVRASTTWYTPDDYAFPNMPYADSIYPREVRSGLRDGLVSPVEGKSVPNRKPKGFSTGFFDYQATDGKLPGVEVTVFSRTLQVPNIFYFDQAIKLKGVNVARFATNYTALTAQTEVNQRQGYGVPYYGMYAGLQYFVGAPVFMSFPHFHQCDPDAFTQSDNSKLGISSTSGVAMYSRVSSYEFGADLNSYLTPIDAAYSKNQEGLYDIYTYIDPWTGKTLGSKVALMVSTTVWNCNPAIDVTCALFLYPGSSYCYPNQVVNGFSSPCSAANVYSPKLIAGKILPNFFIVENSQLDDDTAEVFHNAFRTRLASHIMLVVGTAIGLTMIGYAHHLTRQKRRGLMQLKSTASNVVDDPSKTPTSELSPNSQANYIDDDSL